MPKVSTELAEEAGPKVPLWDILFDEFVVLALGSLTDGGLETSVDIDVVSATCERRTLRFSPIDLIPDPTSRYKWIFDAGKCWMLQDGSPGTEGSCSGYFVTNPNHGHTAGKIAFSFN